MSITMTQYCEFIGTEEVPFDTIPKSERLCEYAGFRYCLKHNDELEESAEGWRLCCEACETPRHIDFS